MHVIQGRGDPAANHGLEIPGGYKRAGRPEAGQDSESAVCGYTRACAPRTGTGAKRWRHTDDDRGARSHAPVGPDRTCEEHSHLVMTDWLTKEQRSRNMSAIRSQGTAPEERLKHALRLNFPRRRIMQRPASL